MTLNKCTLIPFLFSSILSIFLVPLVFGRRDGLSIKLIHRDSIESPLYVANRTFEETFAALSYRSNIHLKQIASARARANQIVIPEDICPPVAFDGDFYMALVGIGTFRVDPGAQRFKSYYLAVNTASRFNINPSAFRIKPNGKGGVAMDVGTGLTMMYRREYVVVREAMSQMFENMGLEEIPAGRLDLCYNMPERFDGYPWMTFHFNGADLDILPQQLFLITPTLFCSAIVPHQYDYFSILIGSHMQANHRFLYRLNPNSMSLAFEREDCETNA